MSSVKKIIGTFDGENENGTTVSRFLWTGETGGEKFSLVTFGPPVVGSKRGEDSSVLQVGKYKLQLACGGCCTPLSSILDIFEEVRVCGGRLHFTCVEQKLYQMGMEIPTWLYREHPLVQVVGVARPDRPEREAFLARQWRGVFGAAMEAPPADVLDAFAALTDGMSFWDLEALRLIRAVNQRRWPRISQRVASIMGNGGRVATHHRPFQRLRRDDNGVGAR